MSDDLPITKRVSVPAADLSWEFMRASGPGGQHVNKSDTAVRLRFALETNTSLREDVKARIRQARPSLLTAEGELVMACESHRSRHRNMAEARQRLADLVREHLYPPKPRRATKPTRASKRRRMDAKRRRGDIKRARQKPGRED